MATEVLMPQMGADMEEGTLLRWLVAEGDKVERGDPIAEIETDKANVEIEAFDSGVFLKAIAREGDIVPVGQPIALLGAADEAGAPTAGGESREASLRSAPENPAQARQATAQAATAVAPGDGDDGGDGDRGSQRAGAVSRAARNGGARGVEGRVRASPVARRMAEEWAVDLSTLAGTGPDGRIVRRDVEAAARAASARDGGAPAATKAVAPAPAATASGPALYEQPDAELRPLSKIRQTIARRMAMTKRDMPHYYVTVNVDMTDAVALRKQINASEENLRVSLNDIVVRATALALRLHPEFNALFSEGGITIRPRINVCIAIALDEGLIAPAIIDTDTKGLRQLSIETHDLAERARAGKLRADEYGAGTFTVSNLGMYGIETLLAIIQPGQSAILGVGAVEERPVVREGAVVVRSMMTVGLSADHRATDGAQGAAYLQTLRALLEAPVRLLL